MPDGDGDVIILDGALSLPFFSHRGKRGKSQPKGAFFPFLSRLISCPHPGRHGEKPSPFSSKGEPLEQLLLEDKGVKNFSRCIAKGNTMGISRGNRANFPKKVELLHPLSLKKCRDVHPAFLNGCSLVSTLSSEFWQRVLKNSPFEATTGYPFINLWREKERGADYERSNAGRPRSPARLLTRIRFFPQDGEGEGAHMGRGKRRRGPFFFFYRRRSRGR